MATAEITTTKNARPIDKFKAYANSQEVFDAFKRVLGGDKEAQMYIGSVIVSVYNKENLQSCSPKSIMVSAMRAAYLRLSVDPAMKQAHLVPYGSEATLIVDYHGLVQLMTNTGLYADVNVSEVYEGEEVKTRRPSSKVEIAGEKISNTIIGYCAYFLMHNGMEKYLYMTNEECDLYGKTYSKSFGTSTSPWNSNGGRDRPAMRRKTVLRILANKWGQYSPYATAVLKDEDGVVDGMAVSLPDVDGVKQITAAPKSSAGILASLGYEDTRTNQDKAQEFENFKTWAAGATRLELEQALLKGLNAAEREIAMAAIEALPEDVEPLLRYNDTDITMIVAQAWDEAPAKVAPILHAMYMDGALPELISASEAALIRRPDAPAQESLL